jgi:hypothetical protein
VREAGVNGLAYISRCAVLKTFLVRLDSDIFPWLFGPQAEEEFLCPGHVITERGFIATLRSAGFVVMSATPNLDIKSKWILSIESLRTPVASLLLKMKIAACERSLID